jgi:tetratricopeptide (TPR) repeat protein
LPPVLIQGETGTGKGLLARAIHDASARADGPFVDVNCAAIPETLLESEMFGVERGAFTDARHSRPGFFELAHRGTIFLDEIALLSEALQAKLLKAIEERAVRRLGATVSHPVDLWVVSATNEDLATAMRSGRFRSDLYHRLAVVALSLPPLRERGHDVLSLAEHLLARACTDYKLPGKSLSATARVALCQYPWPGNIRELGNVMERVALLSDTSVVTAESLALPVQPAAGGAESGAPVLAGSPKGERARLLDALAASSWNISQAAVALGISRNMLRYRMEKHGLRPEPASSGRRSRPATESPPPVTTEPARSEPSTAPPDERRRVTLLRAMPVLSSEPGSASQARRVVELLIDKARTFGGRVEEASAGGIVAIFGLEPVEDAPLRAAHAAMAMHNGVRRLRADAGPPVALKVAIHVAHFRVGAATPAGVAQLESRSPAWTMLESLLSTPAADGIAASEASALFLERRFALAPETPREGGPGRVWRVTGREGTGFGPEGRIATFVGRQDELTLLRKRFETAAAGRGQIVGLVGEAGIGKSRLLFEFRQSLAAEPPTILEGHCRSYGTAVPGLAVLELVRAACGLIEADTPDTTLENVDAALVDAGMDASESAPYLLQLLGLRGGAERLAGRSPEEIKTRTIDVVTQLLLRASARRPLVILVEDLHWIDTISEEYLTALGKRLAGAPVLLVTTYRAGCRLPWMDRSYATQIALPPLDPGHARAVVRSILDPSEIDEAIVDLLLSKAEGNPFFLEELAHAVREQGGCYPELTVPDTLHEVLLARIDRLPAEEKRLLQTAAVIGKDVPRSLLHAVAGLDEATLRQHLAYLQTAEFLVEKSAAPDAEYTFKHALTHDVAYESLAADRQRELHARLLEILEVIYPDRLYEHADRLAWHALFGEVWDKAVVHLKQAGGRAAAACAHPEAVLCFSRALDALANLPDRPEYTEQTVDLHLAVSNSLVPIGEFDRIGGHLREAERLAQGLGHEPRLGRVSSFLTAYLWLTGDHARAVEHGRRALDIATRLRDVGLQVRSNLALAQACHAVGDYGEAIQVLRRNVHDLPGDNLGRRFGLAALAPVLSRAWLAWCLAELGEFTDALASGEEAIRIAEAVNHPYSLLAAYFGVGGVHLRSGEIARATAVLERALTLCRVWDTQLPLWFMGVAPSLGHAYALSGKSTDAIPLLEQAVQQGAATRMQYAQSLRAGWLAHAYLQAGRAADARRLASEALELARRHGEVGHEAWVHGIIGDIASDAGALDAAAAGTAYRRAIALGERLGMRPRVALGHLGLARLHRRAHEERLALEHLTVATGLLRSLQMSLWLREAEDELSLLGARTDARGT